MLKLFDIQNDKVIIHNESLGIPCFRKIWETVKDQSLATDYISYIVFKNKYNSPYVESIPLNSLESYLKQKVFGDSNIKLPDFVIECEKEYVELMNTLIIQLFINVLAKLDSISKYYKNSLDDELDDDKIKVIVASIEKLGNVVKSIETLREKARSEESFIIENKIRGGGQIGLFETRDRT